MKVTIHQPEHLPWTGFFHKMSLCDVYVLLDIVQYEKDYFQNRNKLININGDIYWATVPLKKKEYTSAIREMQIDNNQPWRQKYWRRIAETYRKHPFYHDYAGSLEEIILNKNEYLVELNYKLIEFFRTSLGITNKIVWASDLHVDGKRSELLRNICLKLNADTYLSGPSGKNYLEEGLFSNDNINVEYHEFTPPVYEAPHFIPYLSTLDCLMNHGKNTAEIIGLGKNLIQITGK